LSKFRILAVFWAFLAPLALAGCGETFEWNQKVTVEVETPDGVKSGSSVQRIHWQSGAAYPGMDGPSADSKVTGEAVVVDLGGGKYLFALLSGSHGLKGGAANIASFAFWGVDKAVGTAEGLRFLKGLPVGTNTELKTENYPLLVTFSNINDPSTVQKVDPEILAESLGPHVLLRNIRLEMTTEEMGPGKLDRLLKWIEYPEAALLLNLRPTDFSFAARRRHGEFVSR
jgi:hypothetical protein